MTSPTTMTRDAENICDTEDLSNDSKLVIVPNFINEPEPDYTWLSFVPLGVGLIRLLAAMPPALLRSISAFGNSAVLYCKGPQTGVRGIFCQLSGVNPERTEKTGQRVLHPKRSWID